MQEMPVQPLGREDPLEGKMATKSHGQRSLTGYIVHEVAKSWP